MNQLIIFVMTLFIICAVCEGGEKLLTTNNNRRSLMSPLAMLAAASSVEETKESNNNLELGCKKRIIETKVQNKDKNGKVCSGIISITVCAGRCDSHEVAEWRFPWKRWRHPVCGFGARALSVALLDECDEGANQDARVLPVMRAASCVCRPCQAVSTSCLPLNSPTESSYNVNDISMLQDIDSIIQNNN